MIIRINDTVFTVNESEGYTVLRLIQNVLIPKIDEAVTKSENAENSITSINENINAIESNIDIAVKDITFNTINREITITKFNGSTSKFTIPVISISSFIDSMNSVLYNAGTGVTFNGTGILNNGGQFQQNYTKSITLPIVPDEGIIINTNEDNSKLIIKNKIASKTQKGIVKIGDGISVASDGTISVAGGGGGSDIPYETGTITAQFNTFTSFTGQGGTGSAVGNTFTLNYTKIGNIINIYGVVNSGNFTTAGSNLAIGIKFNNFSFTPAHTGENTMAGSVSLTGQFSAYLQYMCISNNSYIMCVTSPYFIAADPAQGNVKRYEAGQKYFIGYVNFSIAVQ